MHVKVAIDNFRNREEEWYLESGLMLSNAYESALISIESQKKEIDQLKEYIKKLLENNEIRNRTNESLS